MRVYVNICPGTHMGSSLGLFYKDFAHFGIPIAGNTEIQISLPGDEDTSQMFDIKRVYIDDKEGLCVELRSIYVNPTREMERIIMTDCMEKNIPTMTSWYTQNVGEAHPIEWFTTAGFVQY